MARRQDLSEEVMLNFRAEKHCEWDQVGEHAKNREHFQAPVASRGMCGIFQEMKGQT